MVTAFAFWLAPREPPLSSLNPRRFGYFGPTRMVSDLEVRRDMQPEGEGALQGAALKTYTLVQEAGDLEAVAPDRPGPAPGEVPRVQPGTEGSATENLRQVEIPIVQSTEVVIEHLVEPTYPKPARARGLEARVELAALVDERGRVVYIRVIQNTGHPMFEEAAKQALRRCIFRPYREAGRPAKVWVRYPVRFDIIEAQEERPEVKETPD
jgi:protein TonB